MSANLIRITGAAHKFHLFAVGDTSIPGNEGGLPRIGAPVPAVPQRAHFLGKPVILTQFAWPSTRSSGGILESAGVIIHEHYSQVLCQHS